MVKRKMGGSEWTKMGCEGRNGEAKMLGIDDVIVKVVVVVEEE